MVQGNSVRRIWSGGGGVVGEGDGLGNVGSRYVLSREGIKLDSRCSASRNWLMGDNSGICRSNLVVCMRLLPVTVVAGCYYIIVAGGALY